MRALNLYLRLALVAQSLATLVRGAPAVAAPPIDARIFAPTNRTTGLLNPNPVNASCEVLLDLKTINTTAPQQQEPTASQVASSVQTAMSMQIQNLNSTAYMAGFSMMVELPLDAILTGALNASVGSPKPGSNGTIAYPITSGLPLLANGTASQIVNTTIASNTQDVTPRNVLLNGTRCSLALQGLNPTNQPNVGAPLFANLAMPQGK